MQHTWQVCQVTGKEGNPGGQQSNNQWYKMQKEWEKEDQHQQTE